MYIFAMILSSLALLAALGCIALLIYERKCSKKRNTALMQYADSVKASVEQALKEYAVRNTETQTRLDTRIKGLEDDTIRHLEVHKTLDARIVGSYDKLATLNGRVNDLEGGIVPDFEKAKAAADAVNNFNAGISGILGFDPHEVLKKQRSEGGD